MRNNLLSAEKQKPKRCLSLHAKSKVHPFNEPKPFSLMTPEEKRVRLDYLRYRVRVVVGASLFISKLKEILRFTDD